MLLSTTTLRPVLLASPRVTAGLRGTSTSTAATRRSPTFPLTHHFCQSAQATGSLSAEAFGLPLFRRAYTTKPPPSSPRRPVNPAQRAPDPDPAKYARDDCRLPSMIASEQLQKDGKGVEGRHFTDESSIAVSPLALTEPVTGDWTLTHPAYSDEALDAVKIVHRPAVTLSDKIAHKLVKGLRFGYDLLSGYRHRPLPARPETFSLGELRMMGSVMSPDQWLKRIILLEVIAGVPGMVAGTVRHLHSLRRLQRDRGWIKSCLEDAENERMHLLSFLSLAKPGVLYRLLILGAQGVFYNLFFLTYLIAPRVAHRFVGYLEEEAVITYTKCLQDLANGYLPEWTSSKAPEIAVSYWRMRDGSTVHDMIKNVRADEAHHRLLHHTLASLDHRRDTNPFALAEPDSHVKATVPGLSREEAAAFIKHARDVVEQKTRDGRKAEGAVADKKQT